MNEAIDTLRRGRPPNPPRVAVDESTLRYWLEQLEHASKLKAGAMDSESRHMDIQQTIKLIVVSIADDIRSRL